MTKSFTYVKGTIHAEFIETNMLMFLLNIMMSVDLPAIVLESELHMCSSCYSSCLVWLYISGTLTLTVIRCLNFLFFRPPRHIAILLFKKKSSIPIAGLDNWGSVRHGVKLNI